MAKNITARDKDFSDWYHDVIRVAELADYAPVKGCMVIRPLGFAIWENIQATLDREFKLTGHVNACFPLLIPESFMSKEAEHVEGFAPECAVVTHGGGKKLEEPYVIRPTSETVIGHMYAKWIQSYRDLPVLINQWANVMRWEMRTKLFLRTSEFLWQEGHTAHETHEEGVCETLKMLEVYRKFATEHLAIPVIAGLKSESEKFPGAVNTYTIEGMMQDGKALQMGTSHDLGQNFSKAFDITFQGREGEGEALNHAWTTSWGVSTRLIGAVIMTHSDDDGLMLPPLVAPIQVAIVPLFKNDEEKERVLAFTEKVKAAVCEQVDELRVQVDTRTDARPADRFFHWAQRGVPIRIEIGPRDVESGKAMMVRRIDRKKDSLELDEIATRIPEELKSIQQEMIDRATTFRDENTFDIDNYKVFCKHMKKKSGFVRAFYDGTAETEATIKEHTKATVRLLLENEEEGVCILTGKPTKVRALFALSY